MKHPPYHLRLNKAIDRFLLIEILLLLEKKAGFKFSEYTYYGFGGPFLEDCRLLNQYLPEIRLVSIEENKETYKRQKFHRFCNSSKLKLKNMSSQNFLNSFKGEGKNIFW